jgi:DNA-binding NarL/FixJ family response regulator
VISSDDQKENIYEVIQLGVLRFLTKKCDAQEIMQAFHAIVQGEKFFCSRIFNYIFEKSFSTSVMNDPIPLSVRELEIVQLIARGLVAKEISRTLNLSTHTVYTHRKNIMEKLKLKRSSELVLFAVNNGLVL